MRTILALAFLVGIARADAPVAEMSQAETTTWLAFFDKLVDVVVRTSSSPCDRMAGEVNAVIDANGEALAVVRAAHAAGRRLPKAAQQQMMNGLKRMMPGMQRCGGEPKVRAAFAKLDLTPDATTARR